MPPDWTVPAQLAVAMSMLSPHLEAEQGLVVVLDVRCLGKINARHGRRVGTRVVAAVEKSLRRRLSDGVARLPGDQFVVIRPGTTDVDRLATEVARASRVVVLARPCWLVRASTHAGVASWCDASTRRDVLRRAARQCERAAALTRTTP